MSCDLKSINNKKFLQMHDVNFDSCRSFLVAAMVLTHVLQSFTGYNRSLTFFVTIGFVFISGLSLGAVYIERVQKNSNLYWLRLGRRSIKILFLFIFYNTILFLLIPGKLSQVCNLGLAGCFTSALWGTTQEIYCFDILIPLAFVTFMIVPLLRIKPSWVYGIIVLLVISGLILAEYFKFKVYYSFGLLLCGIVGGSFGRLLHGINNWSLIGGTLARYKFVFFILIAAAYGVLYKSNHGSAFFMHLVPTILILFSVYFLSKSMKLDSYRSISKFNKLLSKNMLFIYIVHIIILGFVRIALPGERFPYPIVFTFFLSFLLFMVLLTSLSERFRSRYPFFDRAYKLFFSV